MYIKISDFAKLANRTEAEIYKLLRGRLNKYRNLDLAKKEIDTEAFKELGIEYNETTIVEEPIEDNEVKQDTSNSHYQALLDEYKRQIELLQAEIVRLNGIIEKKDTCIEKLQNDLTANNRKLVELITREQELNKNNQLLLKAEQDRLMIEANNSNKLPWFIRIFKREK